MPDSPPPDKPTQDLADTGAGDAAADALVLAPGSIFAERFKILSLIGTGGMGTVYKATQLDCDRIVAIKILHSHLLTDDTHLRRFRLESQFLSQIGSPHLIKIYSTGVSSDNIPYLALEYIEGVGLKDLISRGALPLERCVTVFRQIAAALQSIHAAGIIHRDLKPSNVVIATNRDGQDEVKVLDFGIARTAEMQNESQKLTSTGAVVGSPDYMSPETLTAGTQIDERSDIYSFGCLMYAVLSGSPPFIAPNPVATAYMHLHEQPRTPIVRPDGSYVPSAIEKLVCQSLAKSPTARIPSAQALSDALADLSANDQRPQTGAMPRKFPVHYAVVGIVMAAAAVLLYFTGPIVEHLRKQPDTERWHPHIASRLNVKDIGTKRTDPKSIRFLVDTQRYDEAERRALSNALFSNERENYRLLGEDLINLAGVQICIKDRNNARINALDGLESLTRARPGISIDHDAWSISNVLLDARRCLISLNLPEQAYQCVRMHVDFAKVFANDPCRRAPFLTKAAESAIWARRPAEAVELCNQAMEIGNQCAADQTHGVKQKIYLVLGSAYQFLANKQANQSSEETKTYRKQANAAFLKSLELSESGHGDEVYTFDPRRVLVIQARDMLLRQPPLDIQPILQRIDTMKVKAPNSAVTRQIMLLRSNVLLAQNRPKEATALVFQSLNLVDHISKDGPRGDIIEALWWMKLEVHRLLTFGTIVDGSLANLYPFVDSYVKDSTEKGRAQFVNAHEDAVPGINCVASIRQMTQELIRQHKNQVAADFCRHSCKLIMELSPPDTPTYATARDLLHDVDSQTPLRSLPDDR